MKKTLTLLIPIFACYFSALANTITVQVKNYQFSPSVVNAVVGDVIQWKWQNGSHTTTSTSVPVGASSWNHNIDASSTSFSYTLTVEGVYKYWCIPHSPNMAGQINVSASLPVSLISFNATSVKLNAALLSWVTSKEENTSYFAVQKSIDGRNFSEIGRVNAIGNSSLAQRYSYTDNNIGNSDPYLYYSLQIVDKDGRAQNSQIIAFKNAGTVSKLIRSITPNPVAAPGHLMLQFYADKTGTMNARVFSEDGRLVLQTDLSADPGLNNGHIHLGDLKPGVYNIVFTMDGKKETQRIVLR